MHHYLVTNVQYMDRIDNHTGEMRSNYNSMCEEFDRVKASYYGDYPPPPFE